MCVDRRSQTTLEITKMLNVKSIAQELNASATACGNMANNPRTK